MVEQAWTSGYQGQVTVRVGDEAVTSWQASWALPAGGGVSQAWHGIVSTSGSTATVTNESWNGSVAAGGTVTFGFTGSGAAPTAAPAVTCSAS